MGLMGATWLPMGLQYLHCHQMMAQGNRGVIPGQEKIVIVQPAHAYKRTTKSSPVGPYQGVAIGDARR